jgi:ankyrin repeat protein
VNRRIVVALVLAVLMATAAYAQTTLLFGVVQKGTPQDVQAAIDMGADVNARDKGGATPLIWAANVNPNPDVITTLLKAGADIELRGTYEGVTALWIAAWSASNPEVVTTLLKAGADINSRDEANNRTVLIAAAEGKSNPEVIIILLKEGLDAKAKDKMGYTAFDYAQYNTNLKGTDALKQLEEASK